MAGKKKCRCSRLPEETTVDMTAVPSEVDLNTSPMKVDEPVQEMDQTDMPPTDDLEKNDDALSEKNDDDLSEKSPYRGVGVILEIGKKKETYIVPHALVTSIQGVSDTLTGIFQQRIRLPDVHEDVGHTLVHYLHTGQYQVLKAQETQASAAKYLMNIRLYYTARDYDLTGLKALARDQLEDLVDQVSVDDCLTAAWVLDYPNDVWLYEHVRSKLKADFATDPTLFSQEVFTKNIGGDEDFSRALVKMMVEIYTEKLESMTVAVTDTAAVAADTSSRSTSPTFTPTISDEASCVPAPTEADHNEPFLSVGEELAVPVDESDEPWGGYKKKKLLKKKKKGPFWTDLTAPDIAAPPPPPPPFDE